VEETKTCKPVSPGLCRVKHEGLERAIELRIAQVDEKFKAMDQALILKSAELERHLEILNNGHAYIRETITRDRDQFLQKSVYDVRAKIMDVWVADTSKRVTILETRSIVWTTALGLFYLFVLAMIQILLHFWVRVP